jgi:Spy/CpxP family protein refolding chaperone
MKALLFFFTLFVCVVAGDLLPQAVRTAAAEPPGSHRHHNRRPRFDRPLERHAERLKLDAATRERIRSIGAEAQREAEPMHERLREARDEMRRLLGQASPDEASVMQQAERLGTLETEMKKQRLRTMLRIRALLTPEQRQELVKIHEERRGRQRQRWRSEDESPRPEGSPPPTSGTRE